VPRAAEHHLPGKRDGATSAHRNHAPDLPTARPCACAAYPLSAHPPEHRRAL